MKTYINGKSDVDTYSGNIYGGVLINLRCVGQTVNVPLTKAMINLFLVTLQVTLRRNIPKQGGGFDLLEEQILNGNLAPYAQAGNYDNSLWNQVSPGVTTSAGFDIFQLQEAAAVMIGNKSIYIPFGGPVDCTFMDSQLLVECTVGQQTFVSGANLLNENLSEMTVDLVPVQGKEQWIPKVRAQVIETNQVAPEYNATGIVNRVMFVNTNITTLLEATAPIASMNIYADGISRNMNYSQLLNDRGERFQASGDGALRLHTFDLIPWSFTKYSRNVRIRPTLATANIAASQNWFISWSGTPNGTSVIAYNNQLATEVTMKNEVMASALRAAQSISANYSTGRPVTNSY